MELIGDEFKNISNHLVTDFQNKKLGNLQELCSLVVDQMNRFYDLFYSFEKEKALVLSEKDIEIHFYLPRLYKKKPGKRSELSDEELEIFNHFRRIGKYINSVTELRIEMDF